MSFIHSILGRRYEMGAGPSSVGGGAGGSARPFRGRRPNDYPGNRRPPPPDRQQSEQSRAAPPASRRAIRQLPTVVVAPEDLVDENNRECCICLEEHNLKDRVIRLPCAHIYHPQCIADWLLKHCTCPVCRYELPTDDPSFEQGRVERMKARKPRFARYELDRMPVKELRSLARRFGATDADSMVEREELVRAVVESGRIELISAPEPVVFPSEGTLRAMGVGKLRRAMEEAGVFFDPIDVVEKEDMVRIFVGSGRVLFEEEEMEEAEETLGESDDGRADEVFDEDGGTSMSCSSVPEDEDDAGTAEAESDMTRGRREAEEEDGGVMEGAEEGKEGPPSQRGADQSQPAVPDELCAFPSSGTGRVDQRPSSAYSSSTYSSSSSCPHTSYPGGGGRVGTTPSQNSQTPTFASRSVAELRSMARELNVDLSGCIEKGEMVDRLVERVSSSAAAGSGRRQ